MSQEAAQQQQQDSLVKQFCHLKNFFDKVQLVCKSGRDMGKQSTTNHQQLFQYLKDSKDAQDQWFGLKMTISSGDAATVIQVLRKTQLHFVRHTAVAALRYIASEEQVKQVLFASENNGDGYELCKSLRSLLLLGIAQRQSQAFVESIIYQVRERYGLDDALSLLPATSMSSEILEKFAIRNMASLGPSTKRICIHKPSLILDLFEDELKKSKTPEQVWRKHDRLLFLVCKLHWKTVFGRLVALMGETLPMCAIPAFVSPNLTRLLKSKEGEAYLHKCILSRKGLVALESSIRFEDTIAELSLEQLTALANVLVQVGNFAQFCELVRHLRRSYAKMEAFVLKFFIAISALQPTLVDWLVENNITIGNIEYLPPNIGSAVAKKLLAIQEAKKTLEHTDRAEYYQYFAFEEVHEKMIANISNPDANIRARHYVQILTNSLYNNKNISETLKLLEKKTKNEQPIAMERILQKIWQSFDFPYLHTYILPDHVAALQDLINGLFATKDLSDICMSYAGRVAWLMIHRFLYYDISKVKPYMKCIKAACDIMLNVRKNAILIAPFHSHPVPNLHTMAIDSYTGFVKEEFEYSLEHSHLYNAMDILQTFAKPERNAVIEPILNNWITKFLATKDVDSRKLVELKRLVNVWLAAPKLRGKRIRFLLDLDPSCIYLETVQRFLFERNHRLQPFVKIQKLITIDNIHLAIKSKEEPKTKPKLRFIAEGTRFCFDPKLIMQNALKLSANQRKYLSHMLMDGILNDDESRSMRKQYIYALAALQVQEKDDEEFTKALGVLKKHKLEDLKLASLIACAFRTGVPHLSIEWLMDEIGSDNAKVFSGALSHIADKVTDRKFLKELNGFFSSSNFPKRGVAVQKETVRQLFHFVSLPKVVDTVIASLWKVEVHPDTRALLITILIACIRNGSNNPILWSMLTDASKLTHRPSVERLFPCNPEQTVSSNLDDLKKLSELQLTTLEGQKDQNLLAFVWSNIYSSYGTHVAVVERAKSFLLSTSVNISHQIYNVFRAIINCLKFDKSLVSKVVETFNTLATDDKFKALDATYNLSDQDIDMPIRGRWRDMATHLAGMNQLLNPLEEQKAVLIQGASNAMLKYAHDLIVPATVLQLYAFNLTSSAEIVKCIESMYAQVITACGKDSAESALVLQQLAGKLQSIFEGQPLQGETPMFDKNHLLEACQELTSKHKNDLLSILTHRLILAANKHVKTNICKQLRRILRESENMTVKFIAMA